MYSLGMEGGMYSFPLSPAPFTASPPHPQCRSHDVSSEEAQMMPQHTPPIAPGCTHSHDQPQGKGQGARRQDVSQEGPLGVKGEGGMGRGLRKEKNTNHLPPSLSLPHAQGPEFLGTVNFWGRASIPMIL